MPPRAHARAHARTRTRTRARARAHASRNTTPPRTAPRRCCAAGLPRKATPAGRRGWRYTPDVPSPAGLMSCEPAHVGDCFSIQPSLRPARPPPSCPNRPDCCRSSSSPSRGRDYQYANKPPPMRMGACAVAGGCYCRCRNPAPFISGSRAGTTSVPSVNTITTGKSPPA